MPETEKDPRRERASRAQLLFIPPLATLAVALLLLPQLLHAIDHGQKELTVAELAGGARPKTRNLIVDGVAQLDYAVTADQRQKEGGRDVSTGQVDLYVPIVAEGWTPADPVQVMLKTHYYGIDELRSERHHTGIARTILWEGLDGKVRDHFTTKLGLHLAPNLVLLDGARPLNHLYWAALAGTFILALLLSLNAMRKRPA
jgi:hypothetical protein